MVQLKSFSFSGENAIVNKVPGATRSFDCVIMLHKVSMVFYVYDLIWLFILGSFG